MDKPTFCRKCHRQIEVPEMLKKIKVGGKISLICGNCGHKNEFKNINGEIWRK